MNIILKNIITASIAFLLLVLSSQAQNWPQWRGPGANGVAEQGNYPISISPTDHLLWKNKLPGAGGSTPIVWKDWIILTSGVGDGEEGEDGVLCYDWKGNQLWEVKLGRQIPGKHPRGSGSSPSAVTDGQRIFVLFKSTTLAALDFGGKVLWKTNLQDTFGEVTYWWDFGTSPVLAEGNVVVAILHEGQSYLLALDQATGKVAWKVDRTYECNQESGQSYTTPLVITERGKTTIVVWGADHLTGHDAKSGDMKWSYSGFNPDNKQYWRTIASPVAYDGVVVVPYGRGRHLAGMKLNVEGKMSEKDWLWGKTGVGTDVATPAVHDGNVYILGFGGKLWCLDVLTGEELWQTQLTGTKGSFYSSPAMAGNRLYMCSDEGSFIVCEVSGQGIKILTQNQFDDHFVASPVLVQDKLLLRGTDYFYCFGSR